MKELVTIATVINVIITIDMIVMTINNIKNK